MFSFLLPKQWIFQAGYIKESRPVLNFRFIEIFLYSMQKIRRRLFPTTYAVWYLLLEKNGIKFQKLFFEDRLTKNLNEVGIHSETLSVGAKKSMNPKLNDWRSECKVDRCPRKFTGYCSYGPSLTFEFKVESDRLIGEVVSAQIYGSFIKVTTKLRRTNVALVPEDHSQSIKEQICV